MTPGIAVIEHPTPVVEDLIVTINVPINPENYTATPINTPKEDNDVTGLEMFLAWESPMRGTADKYFVTRVYTNVRNSENTYNWTMKYAGDSPDHPIYIRTYLVHGDDYQPIALGSKLTGVMHVRMTNEGNGYTSAPTVAFSGGGGAGAAALALTGTDGKVIALCITNEGTGYTSPPAVEFSGGGGTGAAGTAVIQVAEAKLIAQTTEDVQDERLSKIFVRVIRVYQALPGPAIVGKSVSSEFGGGVLDVTRQDVDYGTPVDGGLRVVSAVVQTDSLGKSVLQKAELPEGQSWPIITEHQYITELNGFVKTQKTYVEKSDALTPSRIVAGNGDVIVTEYKDYDKWKSIKIISTLPAALIGTQRKFKKAIQYSVPNEIPNTPTLIKAYAIKPPPNFLGTIIEPSFVTDYAFDYIFKNGYSGPFTADVTRTVDLTSSAESAVCWQESAEMRNIPITLNYNQISTGSASRGKIVELRFPSAIHKAWTINFGDVFTITGTRVIIYTDQTRTVIESDTTYPIGSEPTTPLPFGRWSITPVITKTPLTATFAATTPDHIPRGEPIIAAVHSTEWRFGVFVNDIYRITIPT